MITVITFGVFDLLHFGHINLFRRAKSFGDYLVVAVQNNIDAVKNKPGVKLIDTFNIRKQKVMHCDYVAKVIEYSQIDEDIKKIGFDVLIVGGDQNNIHFQNAIKWCKTHHKEVVFLPRTEGISSSDLRDKI